jgi:hypothetical protein
MASSAAPTASLFDPGKRAGHGTLMLIKSKRAETSEDHSNRKVLCRSFGYQAGIEDGKRHRHQYHHAYRLTEMRV